MYTPQQFAEPDIAVIHQLIRARPLATLITLGAAGINANHIPLYLSESPGPYGTLRGHVARANPLLADDIAELETLAVFHGPDAYISPSWYASKPVDGRVVPTWNYAVAHAYGYLRIVDDAAWLRAQLEALTAHNEAPFPEPWAVADAPPEFTGKLLGAIVGIELVITRLYGKWKVSQNQPPHNQASVIQGLNNSEQPGAAAMAVLVAAKRPG